MRFDETDAGLRRALRKPWAVPDRRLMDKWALDRVRLGAGYAIEGPLNVESSRYMILPMRSLQSDAVRQVNALKGVQTAGSLIGEAWLCWMVENAPGPTMVNYQTEAVMKKQWRMRMRGFLRDNLGQDVFPDDKRDTASMMISFPHMSMIVQGGGKNESNLQTVSVQNLLNDECWQWKGGFLQQAMARTDAFRRKKLNKIYNVSQANEEESDWDVAFHEGIVHAWTIQCEKCGGMQPYTWAHRLDDGTWGGVIWDKRQHLDGSIDVAHACATVRYRCILCGHSHEPGPRTDRHFNKTGAYSTLYPKIAYGKLDRHPNPPPLGVGENLSFWWPSMVGTPLPDLCQRWLAADRAYKAGSNHLKKEFYIKYLATFWNDSIAEEKVDLVTHGFRMGERLPGRALCFITADYQEGRGGDTPHYWVVARDWRRTGASRLVFAGRLESKDEIEALRERLGVYKKAVLVDMRFRTLELARIMAPLGWGGLMGDDPVGDLYVHRLGKGKLSRTVRRPYSPMGHIDPMRGQRGQGRKKVPYMKWANRPIKDMLWKLRNGKGVLWELPEDVPDAYREQMDSEVRLRKWIGGRQKEHWEPLNKNNPNNHLWDCECMQLVAALKAGFIPFELVEDEPANEKATAAIKQKAIQTVKAELKERNSSNGQMELTV